MKKSLLVAAVLATGMIAVQSHAAIYTITDGVDGAYDNTSDFNSVGYNTTLNPATTGVVYEIPVYATVSDLLTGQTGFGNLSILATLSGGGTATFDSAPFLGSTDTYQYKQGKTTVTSGYFTTDQPAGISTPTSEQAVISINAGVSSSSDQSPTDPRYTMGQAGATYSPVLLGFYYVDLPNGASTTTFNVSVLDQGTNNAGVLTPDTANAVLANNAAPIVFSVPEPASLGLMGMGALGLLARRRKTA